MKLLIIMKYSFNSKCKGSLKNSSIELLWFLLLNSRWELLTFSSTTSELFASSMTMLWISLIILFDRLLIFENLLELHSISLVLSWYGSSLLTWELLLAFRELQKTSSDSIECSIFLNCVTILTISILI